MEKNEMTLDEIKTVSVHLLKQFDLFCRENHLIYYISNGTLLGAVKYKGFIPWDDDVDVLMPRSDYDRLLDIFSDSGEIKLFSNEKYGAAYRFPFAKLCDMRTVKIEPCETTAETAELGICIDIFPLDDISNNKIAGVCKIKWRSICLALFSLSQMKTFKSKNFIKIAIYKLSRKIGFENFSKQINKKYKHTFRKCKYIGNDRWPIYGEKELFPVSMFSDTVFLNFEGARYPAPALYDQYLTALYDDYRKDPPIEKQVTHHAYKAYWK